MPIWYLLLSKSLFSWKLVQQSMKTMAISCNYFSFSFFFFLILFLLTYNIFINRWGGPLPQSWLDQQLILQKKILARMYELGMTPGINVSITLVLISLLILEFLCMVAMENFMIVVEPVKVFKETKHFFIFTLTFHFIWNLTCHFIW